MIILIAGASHTGKTFLAVPKSRRMYLGDMDTKDWDFICILYHPNQKREV